jgi:ribonuclease III
MNIQLVQQQIGYLFQDERLLKVALTHKSYLTWRGKDKTAKEHNERLEFLGDAVLELIISEYLYTMYKKNEGYMTSIRASLVNYKIIGQIGYDLQLDQNILMSAGEKAELGTARLTIVADAVEAVLGAIYLDGGYEKASKFVHDFVLIRLADILKTESFREPKTELQEYTQRHYKSTPIYSIIATEGKDHQKVFFVALHVGEKLISEASGKSKQEAETSCAISALNSFKAENIEYTNSTNN